MNKISKSVKMKRASSVKKPVKNFMGGISYEINPLETLKMISASSIFAEPQYYRESGMKDEQYTVNELVEDSVVLDIKKGLSASEVMIDAINRSLDFDFKGTLKWASTLRNEYFMRLNPQIIMVLAAKHPYRAKFNKKNPGLFKKINESVMRRGDEPATQLSCYLYLNNGEKHNLPAILKRSWANKIENLTRYEISKYKNSDIGLINTIRVCHANNDKINELMRNGYVQVSSEEKTWENLRSNGMAFKEILKTIKMPHMALLRNLRNIFKELNQTDDKEFAEHVLINLKNGVKNGKQYPFRYYTAYKMIEMEYKLPFKSNILDALEDCIDLSIENMPKLKGVTACLSDNSGSAWGGFNSEYGRVSVADIDNLSSVITCKCSDSGSLFMFGDRIEKHDVLKRNGTLFQTKSFSKQYHSGDATENGIWLFFKEAITNKIHYDNIFIYSDMQAGHGGLYGNSDNYEIFGEDFSLQRSVITYRQKYIDVNKLIEKYRSVVNPKVNVFCVQTAGYNNVLIPEFTYRGAILYGWTGKESLFASKLIEQWDEIEKNKN